jgi:gliding motility-associated-like protein
VSLPGSQILQLCQGDSVFLGGNWYKDNAMVTINLVNKNGCDSLHNIQIVISSVILRIEHYDICFGDSVRISGQWYKDSIAFQKLINNQNGCDSIINYSISIFPPVFISLENQEICLYDSIQLDSKWYHAPATILQHFINSHGCDSLHKIELSVRAAPLTVIKDIKICNGDSVQINNQWISDEGTIKYAVLNTAGCDSTFEFRLKYFDPITVDLDDQLQVQACEAITIVSAHSPNVISYKWFPNKGLDCIDCDQVIITANNNVRYYLKVTDVNGCIAIDSILLIVAADNGAIFYPNVFSPNGDNINDTWFPVLKDDHGEIISLTIFDRWGNIMHDCKKPLKCFEWDGKTESQSNLPAVYVYLVKWIGCAGEVHIDSGDVTLCK